MSPTERDDVVVKENQEDSIMPDDDSKAGVTTMVLAMLIGAVLIIAINGWLIG